VLNEQSDQTGRQDRREDQNADEYDRHEGVAPARALEARSLSGASQLTMRSEEIFAYVRRRILVLIQQQD
jgi:hypothetical protein